MKDQLSRRLFIAGGVALLLGLSPGAPNLMAQSSSDSPTFSGQGTALNAVVNVPLVGTKQPEIADTAISKARTSSRRTAPPSEFLRPIPAAVPIGANRPKCDAFPVHRPSR